MRIFKKTLKITLIVLLSLVVLVAAVAGTVTYIVFTPDRLTPIVVKQANNFLNAEVNIESVELTFFSTFPNFGLKLNRVSVVSEQPSVHRGKDGFPCGNTHSDSLLTLDALIATIDVGAYLDHKDVIVRGVELVNPAIFAYIDAEGKANFDIVPAEAENEFEVKEVTDDEEFDIETILRNAELSYFRIKNANVYFQDDQQRIAGSLCGFDLDLSGEYTDRTGKGDLTVTVQRVAFALSDTLSKMEGSLHDVRLNLDGRLANSGVANANLNLNTVLTSFAMNDTLLANDVVTKLQATLTYDHTPMITLRELTLQLNDISLNSSGTVLTVSDFSQFDLDLQLGLNIPSLANLLGMVPTEMVPEAALARIHGAVEFSGSAKGLFKDSTSMPVVSGDLLLRNISGSYRGVPYRLDRLNSTIGVLLDLNEQQNSFANIKRLDASALDAQVSVTGMVRDLLGDPLLGVAMKVNADLEKTAKHLPLDSSMSIAGLLTANLKTNMRLSDALDQSLNRLKVSGNATITELAYSNEADTMSANIGDVSLDFETNVRNATRGGSDFLAGKVSFNAAQTQIGTDTRANVRTGSLTFTTSNVTIPGRLPTIHSKLDLRGITARVDDSTDVRVMLRHLHGTADVRPSARNPMLPHVAATLELDSLRARMGNDLITLASGRNNVVAEQSPDTTVGFKGWQAAVNLDYTQLQAFTPSFPERIYVDKVVAHITDKKQELKRFDIRVGESDFHLEGTIENLLPWLNKEATIQTNMKLTANNLDLNQLMRIAEVGKQVNVSAGLDVENPEHVEAIRQAAPIDTTPPTLKAILLPTDVFASFETDIRRATFGKMELENVHGGVTLVDGALILRELGVLANKKTRMQVTAIHRTPRINHVFAGMNLHFWGVELGDLQEIIPDVDSVLPMLRSFEGAVDFHLAIQTFLDSNFNIKFSTLRGGVSIHGKDLVLLDNSTFATIANTLKFKQRDRNIIDSLDVEVAIFDSQVELYPFVVTMDRYTAGIGGFHSLDMNVDYHVSILQSPIPARLAVDVRGHMDDVVARPLRHVSLTRPKYDATFRPQRRNVTRTAEEELRDMMRASLRRTAPE